MILDENILISIDCNIYKYNYSNNSFQIRNYFKTDNSLLIKELDEIIKVLVSNKIKFNILKDNTIKILD